MVTLRFQHQFGFPVGDVATPVATAAMPTVLSRVRCPWLAGGDGEGGDRTVDEGLAAAAGDLDEKASSTATSKGLDCRCAGPDSAPGGRSSSRPVGAVAPLRQPPHRCISYLAPLWNTQEPEKNRLSKTRMPAIRAAPAVRLAATAAAAQGQTGVHQGTATNAASARVSTCSGIMIRTTRAGRSAARGTSSKAATIRGAQAGAEEMADRCPPQHEGNG